MNMEQKNDIEFMQLALQQAREAAAAGEVPVGAIAVIGGKMAACARNRVEEKNSVTCHAEIEVLRELEVRRRDWRMEDVTLYVTKEPCPMCAGALVNARVRRIVYGAADPQAGGITAFGIPDHPGVLSHPEVTGGVCAAEAEAMLSEFFRGARRKRIPITVKNTYDPVLDKLTGEVFNFNFRLFAQHGLWTEQCESSAIYDGERMIAHVGLTRMRFRVGERDFTALQLWSVATAPDRRGEGHSARLIRSILKRYSGTPVFLFANESVLDFYPKFGFVPGKMETPVSEISIDNELTPVPASLDDALALAGERRLRSGIWNSLDDGEMRGFHLLYDKPPLYRLASGVIAAAEQRGETLQLHDIFSNRRIDWNFLKANLPFHGIRRIEWGFPPDRLGCDFRWESWEGNLFLLGDWQLPEHFIIPEYTRT